MRLFPTIRQPEARTDGQRRPGTSSSSSGHYRPHGRPSDNRGGRRPPHGVNITVDDNEEIYPPDDQQEDEYDDDDVEGQFQDAITAELEGLSGELQDAEIDLGDVLGPEGAQELETAAVNLASASEALATVRSARVALKGTGKGDERPAMAGKGRGRGKGKGRPSGKSITDRRPHLRPQTPLQPQRLRPARTLGRRPRLPRSTRVSRRAGHGARRRRRLRRRQGPGRRDPRRLHRRPRSRLQVGPRGEHHHRRRRHRRVRHSMPVLSSRRRVGPEIPGHPTLPRPRSGDQPGRGGRELQVRQRRNSPVITAGHCANLHRRQADEDLLLRRGQPRPEPAHRP